jgi:hypothetical protein
MAQLSFSFLPAEPRGWSSNLRLEGRQRVLAGSTIPPYKLLNATHIVSFAVDPGRMHLASVLKCTRPSCRLLTLIVKLGRRDSWRFECAFIW